MIFRSIIEELQRRDQHLKILNEIFSIDKDGPAAVLARELCKIDGIKPFDINDKSNKIIFALRDSPFIFMFHDYDYCFLEILGTEWLFLCITGYDCNLIFNRVVKANSKKYKYTQKYESPEDIWNELPKEVQKGLAFYLDIIR